MGDPTIGGLKPLKLMQWRTHFYNRPPKVEIAGEMTETTVVNGAVEPVKERWVYVIAETQDRKTGWEIFEEAYVDDRGRYHKVTKGRPYAPIEERGDPSPRYPKHTVLFPKFSVVKVGDTDGDSFQEPLWIRLLIAPFRLPSAVTALLGRKFRDEIAEHIRPLWDWKKGRDEKSPLIITDSYGEEWSYQATPLWFAENSTHLAEFDKLKPIAVGFDPFTVAENLSLDYVEACERLKTEFEKPNAKTSTTFQKMALLDLIENTVLASDEGKKRYKSALDISKMNTKFKQRTNRRTRLVKEKERAGGALCEVLSSPFVELYQQAGFSTEGLDTGALGKKKDATRSPRLDELIRWLGVCTRALNESLAGRALLDQWVEDSEKRKNHFINQTILPTIVPPVHYFKSFRWGSKAIASVLAQFISHKVAKTRSWTALKLSNEVMTPLTKLAQIQGTPEWTWFADGTFDPKKHIKGIGVAGDIIQTDNMSVKYLDVDIQVSPNKIDKISVLVVEPNKVDFIADWIDAGELKDFGRHSKFLNAKLLASFILDGLNVALAFESLRDKWGERGQLTAGTDFGVAALSLVVNITELYFERLGLSQTEVLKATRAFSVVRGITGAYYGWKDIKAAQKAFRQGDKDYGTAMYVAAGLEFTAAAATFYTAAAAGSTLGPWVGVIAGLLAAGAYIVAGLLKDDELEEFLKRCEWGASPYLAFDTDPKWCTTSPNAWGGDYLLQQRFLLRILSQVSVGWVSHANETLGVSVQTQMLCPQSTISVELIGTLRDGGQVVDLAEFAGASLPAKVPGAIVVRPSRTVNDWTHPKDLMAIVRFRLTPDSDAEVLDFPLVLDGVDQPDERLSNV